MCHDFICLDAIQRDAPGFLELLKLLFPLTALMLAAILAGDAYFRQATSRSAVVLARVLAVGGGMFLLLFIGVFWWASWHNWGGPKQLEWLVVGIPMSCGCLAIVIALVARAFSWKPLPRRSLSLG